MSLSLSKLMAVADNAEEHGHNVLLTPREVKRLLAIAKASLVAREKAEDVFLAASSENIVAFNDADKALRASLEGVEL